MERAIIGFIGVIVGAIIVAGSNYLIASKRERADTQKENRNHVIEIKRASRLIDADLSRANAAAKICVEKRHWWSADAYPLTIEGWQQYRGIIAPELSYNAWVTVRVAVEAVDNLKTARDISINFAEQSENNLTAMAKELAEEFESIQAWLTAISKEKTVEEIEGLHARLTTFRNNTEKRITVMRVRQTEIPDSTAKQIVLMLNDIEAGRIALSKFMLDQSP
ncbi:MAG: hypothetical protein R6W88_14615 [Desulfobacterales bacterium]